MKLLIVITFLTFASCNQRTIEERYAISDIDVKNLMETDAEFRSKYLDNIPSLNKTLGKDYRAYIYNEKTVGQNKAVFVYLVRDSYGIIQLLLIDKNDQLLSSMEVAGVNCPTPTERDDGTVEWCDENLSIFSSDSTFSLVNIKKVSEGFEENAKVFIDSTVFKYIILNQKEFKNINKEVYQFERGEKY